MGIRRERMRMYAEPDIDVHLSLTLYSPLVRTRATSSGDGACVPKIRPPISSPPPNGDPI